MGEVVMLDPYHPYALMLVEHFHRQLGIRTVCLHSSWRRRLLLEGRLPLLRSPAVAGHYMLGDLGWERISQTLRSRHRIVGVVPFEEGMVDTMSRLAQLLGLAWAQPDVLPAFRDKHRLKALIGQRDPSVRLNAFAIVSDPDEALAFATRRDLERFVLKPNDGSGNRDVAFFDKDVARGTLDAYFAGRSGDVLMEEYVHGPEYWVNGQVDESGRPLTTNVGRYVRTARGGVANLEIGTLSVAPDDPAFGPLCDYARAVVRATGLRRSPFHLEAIVDARGPCLVEVGARLCGELGAVIDTWHHGRQFDLVALAAHYYVSDAHYDLPGIDWTHYSRHWVGTATGDSASDQRIARIEGLDVVERSPHFLFWIKRPEVGDFVHATRSLTTRAWSVALQADSEAQLRDVIDWTRRTVRLHGAADGHVTLPDRWRMARALGSKAWRSRPRAYQLGAVMRL